MGARFPLIPGALLRALGPWAAALALSIVCAAACVVLVRGLLAVQGFNALMGGATWDSASYLHRETLLGPPRPPSGGK